MIKDYCDYGKLTFHITLAPPPPKKKKKIWKKKKKKKTFFFLSSEGHSNFIGGPDLARGPPID